MNGSREAPPAGAGDLGAGEPRAAIAEGENQTAHVRAVEAVEGVEATVQWSPQELCGSRCRGNVVQEPGDDELPAETDDVGHDLRVSSRSPDDEITGGAHA